MSKPRQIPIGQRNIVGAKVVQVREAKRMKQKELVALLQSKGMDISDTSMSRLEGQNRLVQDFEVPILADALGVSVEWLLSRED
jgi:transcriptional regulator with XRE-family HTH domain